MSDTRGPESPANLDATATGTHSDSPTSELAPEALARGAALGHYIVISELGRGAMGLVYSAFDPDLDRKVALKVLRKSRDPAARSRLLREAQAMAKLSHPNVVTIFEVDTDGDRDFVSMEFVDGLNLSDWSREEHPIDAILEVYRQAGQGLAAAHRAGVVHRDFKPHNVLIDKDGRVRVTDFGLAQTADADVCASEAVGDRSEADASASTASLTRTGAVMGTPAYMSPEQHLGGATDARSDQFSFCVALYQALCGEAPFEAASYVALRERVTKQEAPLLPESVPVSSQVRSALAKGMSGVMEERHGSMDELLAELEDAPDRKAKTWMLLAAAALLVFVVVVLAFGGSKGTRCVADRSQLDGIWDSPSREKIRNAFLDTKLPGGMDVFRKFESATDDYADSLVSMRLDICQAERGNQAAPDGLLLKRLRCLQRRRRGLASLTRAFSNVDSRGVERAVEAVLALPLVAECADQAALERGVAGPPPSQREEVDSLQASLGEARSQAEAGHVKVAIARAEAALERSRSLGYKPLLAEAYEAVGSLYGREARVREAELAFEESILASEESGYTEYRARALVGMTRLIARASSRFADARRYGRRAKAAIIQWGGDPVLSLEVEQAMARILVLEGKLDEALELLEVALSSYVQQANRKSVKLASLQSRIAGIKVELGDYDEAHMLAESSYELMREELGDSNPRTQANLSTLTTTHRMRGNYKQAHEMDKSARNYWESEAAIELLQESGDYIKESRSLRGMVVDRHGERVEGATVVCGQRVIADGAYLDVAWDASVDALRRKRITLTAADGSFHCVKTSTKDLVVVADKQALGRSAMASVKEGEQGQSIQLVLRPTGVLRGRVVKDGSPAPPQAVTAVPLQESLAQPVHAATTFLRADGSYEFERLAPGSYLVFSGPRASTSTVRLHSEQTEIKPGGHTLLDFDQSEGDAALHLQVKGEDGAAMPSVQVLLTTGHLDAKTGKEFNARAVSAGVNVRSHFLAEGDTLELDGLDPGLHSICIVPLGGDYRDPEHMKRFTAETMEQILVYCQDVHIDVGQIKALTTQVPAWKPLIVLAPEASSEN